VLLLAIRARWALRLGGETDAPRFLADFVTDAHHHCKLIAYHPDAEPLLDAAGVLTEVDEGYVALDSRASPSTFLERCRELRHWDRAKVPATAW